MKNTPNTESGYTLTELLVVLVILGLIAAAITPQVMGRLDRSKSRAAELQLESLAASLDLFKIDVGRYPTTEEGVNALLSAPAQAQLWDGPYVRSVSNLKDPWGSNFVYRESDSALGFEIVSFGADNSEGGTGDAADLVFPDFELASDS